MYKSAAYFIFNLNSGFEYYLFQKYQMQKMVITRFGRYLFCIFLLYFRPGV